MTINLELQHYSTNNLSGAFTNCEIDSNIINKSTATNNKLKLFLMEKQEMDSFKIKNRLELLISKLNSDIESLAREAGMLPSELSQFISNKFTNKHNANSKECVNIVDKVEGDQIFVSGGLTKNYGDKSLEIKFAKLSIENSELKKTIEKLEIEISSLKANGIANK